MMEFEWEKLKAASYLRGKEVIVTLGELFSYIFADMPQDYDLELGFKEEIQSFIIHDKRRIAVKEQNKKRTNLLAQEARHKAKRRDVKFLKEFLEINKNHRRSYIEKKRKVKKLILKHFGKYESKYIDITNKHDIIDAIESIQKEQTLIFDTTTEKHRYTKSSNEMSLKSQMYEVLDNYLYNLEEEEQKKVIEHQVKTMIDKFLQEIFCRESRPLKNLNNSESNCPTSNKN